jgi:hypothetical protein
VSTDNCIVVGCIGVANATLWDRGGGLIYDDVLEITWLQDATYAADGSMGWGDAMTWAKNLSYIDSVRGVTSDDWRLPDAHNQDRIGPDSGRDVTGGEMGHMHYTHLGGGGMPNSPFTDGNGNSVSFQHLQEGWYWSSTAYSKGEARFFYCVNDYQATGIKSVGVYARAVRAWFWPNRVMGMGIHRIVD